MHVRTKAVFSTGLKAKTSIWPGDVVRYDNGGVYIWRRGDTTLERPGKGRYLIKNPAMLSASQIDTIAQDTANLIGAMTGLPVIVITGPDKLPAYQLGDQK